jgi:hypothetical protein
MAAFQMADTTGVMSAPVLLVTIGVGDLVGVFAIDAVDATESGLICGIDEEVVDVVAAAVVVDDVVAAAAVDVDVDVDVDDDDDDVVVAVLLLRVLCMSFVVFDNEEGIGLCFAGACGRSVVSRVKSMLFAIWNSPARSRRNSLNSSSTFFLTLIKSTVDGAEPRDRRTSTLSKHTHTHTHTHTL